MTLVDVQTRTAAPKYATPRDPSAPSDGRRIAAIGAALGKPFMPWQQLVADVGTERDAFGNYKYEIVLVTVPRQSGKTTLVGPVQLDRIIMNPGIRCFYTAQTGMDAGKRFEDLVSLVKGSPLGSKATYKFAAGDKSITVPGGSQLKIFSPGMAALHGETPPLVTLDEIWEYDELLGDAMLEGAIIPAQMTLAGRRQIWMISTAGTAASVFMKKWVERGRESVRTGGKKFPKLAYFEWGLPDGADPYDPEVIASFHPAVGHTVSVDELLAIETSHANWLRAFCNVWTEVKDPLFSDEHIATLNIEPLEKPDVSDLTITYELAPDDELGTVMASWRDTDGVACSRVVHTAPGSGWMVDFILKLRAEWKPAVLGADDGGPVRKITDELRRRIGDDTAVTTVGGRDSVTAAEGWLTMVRDSQFKHDGSKTITRGVQHLVLKRVGDVTRFSRSGSSGPIVGPVASAAGIWLHDHREVAVKPFLRT